MKENLSKIANELKDQNAAADIFPYAVIDDLFPQSIFDAILAEVPESLIEPNLIILSVPALDPTISSTTRVQLMTCPYTKMITSSSRPGCLLNFSKIYRVSNVSYPTADPHFNGGGVHFNSNGGKLDLQRVLLRDSLRPHMLYAAQTCALLLL